MDWVVLILISAAFISLRNILTKQVLRFEQTLPVLFWISALSAMVMALFKGALSVDMSLASFSLIFLKSTVILIGWWCGYEALKNSEISTIAPLKNLSPIILVVLGVLILHESPTIIQSMGIALLILSAYLLETKSLKTIFIPAAFFRSKYFIFVIVALIANSISAIIDKIVLQSVPQNTLMFWFYAIMAILYFFVLLFRNESKCITEIATHKYRVTVIAITAAALVADYVYFAAVAIPGTLIMLIIPLRHTSTLLTTILGGKFFHESNVWYKASICLVMIIGIILITI